MKRLLLLLTAFAAATTLCGQTSQPVRIFLVGDSTCATKNLWGQNPERGWGHMFQPLFDASVVVENHATNGRSTKSFRDEGRWAKVYDKLKPGDYVFIQFGHNDQKTSDSTRYASPAQFADNMRRYVSETRAKGAVPVLLTPVVRRNFVDGVLTDTHGEYAAVTRRIAAEEDVVLIDAEQMTREWIGGLGDEASKSCYVYVDKGVCALFPDGRKDDTHLNTKGARTLARMIARQLGGVVPELAAHLADYYEIVIAKDGSGDFFTLSEAVAAIPDFGRTKTRILISEGVYREKVSIPASKRNVVLQGRGDVVITWDDYATKKGTTGVELGTSGTATVYFGGEGWTVFDITFENSAGRVGQAVAVQCLGDNTHFVCCRFLGNQDTLYLYGTGNREGEKVGQNISLTFTDCYIEGTTDFIFGPVEALFSNCEIRSKHDSYVTAASTCRGQKCGFIFVNCRLTADEGVTKCYLGRPWREYAQTVFISCELGAHILPEGWHDWDKPRAHKTAFYAEYGSTGPGAAPKQRVKWSRQLSEKKARRLLDGFNE